MDGRGLFIVPYHPGPAYHPCRPGKSRTGTCISEAARRERSSFTDGTYLFHRSRGPGRQSRMRWTARLIPGEATFPAGVRIYFFPGIRVYNACLSLSLPRQCGLLRRYPAGGNCTDISGVLTDSENEYRFILRFFLKIRGKMC